MENPNNQLPSPIRGKAASLCIGGSAAVGTAVVTALVTSPLFALLLATLILAVLIAYLRSLSWLNEVLADETKCRNSKELAKAVRTLYLPDTSSSKKGASKPK